MSAITHPELIFGGALIGLNYTDAASVSSLLSTLRSAGITAIDTAARYPPNAPGRSEELLGESGAGTARDHPFMIDSKVLTLGGAGDLEPAKARTSVETSLRRLGISRLRTLYIHIPDTSTPVIDQARGLDQLHREGKFEHLGISNFSPKQVDEFVDACEQGGYVRPSVFQGEYSLIQRSAEKELFPTLRRHGIRHVSFRVLAAGFLREGTFDADGNISGGEGTRFASNHPLAGAMNSLYGGERARKAHELAMSIASKAKIAPLDMAMRWICYHSELTESDAVLLGASKEFQILKNLEAVRAGPLPETVAEDLSQVWHLLEGR